MTRAQLRKLTIKRRIDRRVDGVGRVCLRTGARTAVEHRARVALFERLVEADQLDVIHLLMDGAITWTELRQADRKKRLHSDALAADVALTRPLWDHGDVRGALATTLPRMGRSDSTRERYAVAFGQLRVHAADFLPAAAAVKALKDVPWAEAFGEMEQLSPASRNRVRSALSAFLTVFLGDKYHPFRRAVMKGLGGMEDERTAPREVTLEEFWTLMDHVDDALVPSFLTLAASGMRIGEYLACTETSIRRLPVIWIPSGKTGGRETSVAEQISPFVRQAIPCRIAPTPESSRGVQFDARYKRLWKAMAAASKATDIPCSPHYLRHLYAQLGTAELPTVLVRKGLGHKHSAMTDRYADRRTTQQVAAVVGNALMPPNRVRKKVRSAGRRKAS